MTTLTGIISEGPLELRASGQELGRLIYHNLIHWCPGCGTYHPHPDKMLADIAAELGGREIRTERGEE